MIQKYNRLRAKQSDEGLTLIELLIVIVILGILSATIVFAVGGMTAKSAYSSCQTDWATMSTAVDSFNAQNPGVTVTTKDLTSNTTMSNGNMSGGPYVSTMPTNGTHYMFTIVGGVLNITAPTSGTPLIATGVVGTGTVTGPSGTAAGTVITAPIACYGVK